MAKKIKRKDLKSPDQFVSYTTKAFNYAVEKRNVFLPVILALIGIALVVYIGNQWYAHTSGKASALLGDGMKLLSEQRQPGPGGAQQEAKKTPEERCAAAGEKFKELTEKYSGSGAAGLARITWASCLYETGKTDEALTLYGKFLETARSGDPLLPLVQEGMAYAYETKGEDDKALEMFKLLAEGDKKPSTDAALYHLAMLHKKAGRSGDEMAALKRLVDEFPGSQYRSNAESMLSELPAPEKATEGKGGAEGAGEGQGAKAEEGGGEGAAGSKEKNGEGDEKK